MYYLTQQDYDIAQQNGIGRQNLYQRYYMYDWDKERAMTEPIHKRERPERSEWVNVAKANGVSDNLFCMRINKLGWSVRKAATTPVRRQHDRNTID